MNELFLIGLLIILGYFSGLVLQRVGMPKIIGYIIVGVLFSPYSFDFVGKGILDSTEPVIDTCLGFIAFEVGGSLYWQKLKNYKKQLVNILLFESLSPFFLIIVLLGMAGYLFPGLFTFEPKWVFVFALLIAPLASPTDPTATLAVTHEYRAKGKVSNTIMEIAALDDALGVFLFSLSLGAAYIFAGSQSSGIIFSIFKALYSIFGAIAVGIVAGIFTRLIGNFLKVKNDGQWIVVLAAFIILSFGLASMLGLDELLASMSFGAYTINFNEHKDEIFGLIERYTEELIVLIFFILSGLHLDITAISDAYYLIFMFVVLRMLGKYFGARVGAYMGDAPKEIQKYIGGGLLPQGGIVIGLALMVSQDPVFSVISDTLLAVVMGSAVLNEIIGPFSAKTALTKAGEIKGD